MNTTSSHRWFAVAALLVAIVGQGTFMLRVAFSGLGLWPEPEPLAVPLPWVINLGLLLFFAAQHSAMARQWFKDWLASRFPVELERSLYVALAGVAVLTLTLLWQTVPGEPAWHGPIWIVGIAFAGLTLIGWCFLAQQPTTFLGLRPFEPETLQVTGLYRFVRHPLMLGLLLFLWGQPVMTATLASLSGGMTAYILVALPLEERELVRKFGSAYETYRRAVPALIPWRVFRAI